MSLSWNPISILSFIIHTSLLNAFISIFERCATAFVIFVVRSPNNGLPNFAFCHQPLEPHGYSW